MTKQSPNSQVRESRLPLRGFANGRLAFRLEHPTTTRYSLLSRLKDWEDQDSWQEFFESYGGLIYSFAIRAGLTESEAEDTVQETIISVAKDISKFQHDRKLGSFKGWLRNLTRWRIADQLRKRQLPPGAQESCSREISDSDLERIPDPKLPGLESKWEEEWKANLLESALKRIKSRVKDEHFQIIDLYVVKGWPVTRVARRLGVSLSQVYVVKHRLASLLKKEIQNLEKGLS